MTEKSRDILLISKNISFSCSVCHGLGIVLAMTRVQRSVHVADNHRLLQLVLLKVSNVMSLQTVPVGLRYKLVAVLKSEGGSPTSVYVSASTVPAYPYQSYKVHDSHKPPVRKTDVQLSTLLALLPYSLPTLR